MELATNLKYNKKTYSLKQKSLFAFGVLSISFIALIWIFQAIFFSVIYENIKRSEVNSILHDIAENYNHNANYENFLQETSLQNDVNILIFKENNNAIDVLYNTYRNRNEDELIRSINSVLINMNNVTETNFTSGDKTDFKMLTSCLALAENDTKIYFSVSSVVVPTSTLTNNFHFLLVFISIGVMCLTLIGAYILSSSLSRPISNIAKKAKEITNSNDIHFNSEEYTEIKELSSSLNFAIDELKKTDKIRKEVLANVSHELKTPLTMIKSYTELIKDISGNNPKKREEHLDVIYSEATRLELLLADMMDYSKLESGIITYNKTKFNLSDCLERFYSIYQEKFTNFIFDLDIVDNAYIFADQARIEQVITNLLNNAINYSGNNKHIEIKLTEIQNQYKLDIIDHGIGISQENLKHIFDRHFRTTSAKRATVGSGIGLSIVKSILNDHKFDFGVTSEENVGSDFYIFFPTSYKEGDTNE